MQSFSVPLNVREVPNICMSCTRTQYAIQNWHNVHLQHLVTESIGRYIENELFSHMFESQNNDEIIRYNLFLNDC